MMKIVLRTRTVLKCSKQIKSSLVSTSLEEQIINSVRENCEFWHPAEKLKYAAQTLEFEEQVCREVG